MKKLCFLLIVFAVNFGFGQTIQDAIDEAKRRNISTQQEALQALAENGITEAQARQLARVRGIDFDEFMQSFLTSQKNTDTFQGQNISAKESLTFSKQQFSIEPESDPVKPIEQDRLFDQYFGYNIFQNNPFGSKEYLVGNIDEGYIIAPGDELRLTVFGNNQMDLVAKVDLNGNINIPNFGVFLASGSTFETLKTRLTTYLGRYFSGLLSSPRRTFLDVSLTQIRPVKITVLGESFAPGAHLVSGFATVLNALYASGGVKTSGSLREIKVFRNNKLLKTVDLYDYITSGNLDGDVRLANNDIVFIPSRLSTVELTGTVKKEALFEMKPGENLSDLIRFSGGLPANAATNNVNIQRITPFENRTQTQRFDRFITTVNYGELLALKEPFPLMDGDFVKFESVLDRTRNGVIISGNVSQPGEYSVEQYGDLQSLIVNAAKDVLPNTYMSKVDVFREDNFGNKGFTTFNLSSVLEGATKVQLTENDIIQVYAMSEVQGEKLVRISGFTKLIPETNGEIEEFLIDDPLKAVFWRKGMSLFDLIFQATSYEELEYQSKLLTSRVDLKRFNPISGLFEISNYSLDDLQTLQSTFLLPKDEVILYSKSILEVVDKTIQVGGYVNLPNTYPLASNMYIEDAILAAGGFTEYADKDLVVVNRENYNPLNGKLSDRYEVKVDLAYLKGETTEPANPFILEDNDVVSVRKPQGKGMLKTLQVQGAVIYPRSIVLEYELNSFVSILDQVGGLKPYANLRASYVLRDGKTLAYDLSENQDSEKAVFEDGDVIVIASNNGTVETMGAVQNPSLFVWEKGKRAKNYLYNSGGKIRKEADGAYLVLPNGRTKRISFFSNPKVQPNSTVMVNRKIKKEADASRQKFTDDLIRLLSVVTGAFTTIILAKNL